MLFFTSKLTPDSVVTYLFHDCERSDCSACGTCVRWSKYSTPQQPTSSARVRNVWVWLSTVSYDPLSHSRHNAGDRSAKVGHEIMKISETPRPATVLTERAAAPRADLGCKEREGWKEQRSGDRVSQWRLWQGKGYGDEVPQKLKYFFIFTKSAVPKAFRELLH